MICFNCGLQLHNENETECQVCGVKFAVKCPSCRFPNPGTARFCFNCGYQMQSLQQSSVHNFEQLTESRKNVAVIFADVSGFTTLAEEMDPEEVREIINDCFRYITKPVYELEGTIDKYIGDCVMILFGAKYSHSDDAKRAVLCAMKMMDLVREFSEERLSSIRHSLNLSIGVNYGLVVTGSVGNYFDKDYTVMGDIVNTAQRLQSSAGEGSILVSESVYMETRDKMEYSKVKEVAVKNRKTPVRCYMPIRMNSDMMVEGEAVFVEREKELSALNSFYNSALNTGTEFVWVVGEAGIGKSRLLKEFTSKIGSDIKKVWVDCNPVSQNRPYSMLSNILMGIMNINLDDSINVKQHRLASFLDYILSAFQDEDIKKTYDFLGLVLGLGRDREFQNVLNAMSYEDIRREMLKHLSIFFSNLCDKYRLFTIVDDMHWADSNSLQVLKELMPYMPAVNALFVFSCRYELKDMRLEEKDKEHIIKLMALSAGGIRELLCRQLSCASIDDALYETALKFTNGNPLYIEEFVLNIKRTGLYVIRDGIASMHETSQVLLPGNIQSLILSNISDLDDRSKAILQVASVIGKEFRGDMISSLLDGAPGVEEALKQLLQMNIISVKSVHASAGVVEKVYTFNHDMEREVIYESLLNKNKKELHRRIGEYTETRYPSDLENHYETLCHHFEKAGLTAKAADYAYQTAVKHKDTFNFTNALEYYSRFLEWAAQRTKDEVDIRRAAACRDMGYIYYVMAQYEKALNHLQEALEQTILSEEVYSIKIQTAEVYREQGRFSQALELLEEMEPRLKEGHPVYGRILQMKCNILLALGNPEALGYAERAQKILLKVKDYTNLSETMKQTGILYFSRGDVDQALHYLNESYRYAEKTRNLEIMAKVSGNLGIVYHATGMISKALEAFHQSMEISRKISYLKGYIAVCINLGILYMEKGLFDRARGLFEESLKSSREIKSRLYECISLINLGDILYEKGMDLEALQCYQQSQEIAREIHVQVEEGVNYIGMGKVLLRQEKPSEAHEALDQALRVLEEAEETTYFSDCYFYKGLYESKHSRYDKALEYCEKAIGAAEECSNDHKRLKALRLKGSIYTDQRNYSKAVELFEQAIRLAEQVESDYEVAKGYYGKYKVYQKTGAAEEAEACLEKAKASIQKVDPCRWTGIIENADRTSNLEPAVNLQ